MKFSVKATHQELTCSELAVSARVQRAFAVRMQSECSLSPPAMKTQHDDLTSCHSDNMFRVSV